jgi:PAS domain S-box-containing protein
MRSSLSEFGPIAGFVVLALLLAANALITWRRLEAQINLGQWVIHTHDVRAELSQAETELLEIENGERGYLLTGDQKFMELYQRAEAGVAGHVDNLARLTADNPVQRNHIAELRMLVQEQKEDSAKILAQYAGGAVKEPVLPEQDWKTTESIRQDFNAMLGEEAQLDKLRSTAYRQGVQLTIASVILSLLAGVLGLAVLALIVAGSRALRERHAAEIRQREEWFRVTLTSIGDAVIATGPDGKVEFLNPEAERLTGRKLAEVKGKNIKEVFPIVNETTGDTIEDPVGLVVSSGQVVGLANHTALKRADGVLTPIEDSAAPIRDDRGELAGVVLVFRDVTAERKQQEILRKTEKLSTAARLSATMAHEINNPLAAVVNLIFIARNMPEIPAGAVEHLELAEQELERVTHITRQTLGFYRESTKMEPVDLAALVDSVVKFYQSKLAAKSISIWREFGDCPPVNGVAGELRQAVSNLVANAIDAVSEGGAITMSTRTVAEDGRTFVKLEVADDGLGIAAEHFDRLFEPFFTTKKEVGTGLGLWAAKNIVERHGGAITVIANSSDGESSGAVFTVRLPGAAAGEA